MLLAMASRAPFTQSRANEATRRLGGVWAAIRLHSGARPGKASAHQHAAEKARDDGEPKIARRRSPQSVHRRNRLVSQSC